MAVRATPLTGSPPADQAVVVSDRSVYHGCSVREAASSAAVAAFNVRATSASGPIIDVIELAANGSVNTWYDKGIDAPGGIYFDVIAGEVAGSIFHS